MIRHVVVTAPVRIADLGGWTDTWFAGCGAVCHLTVRPGIEVTLSTGPRSGPQVVVEAPDLGARYELPDHGACRAQHALLAAAIEAGAPAADRTYHVRVTSGVPPGASAGTSAAVTVAILAAFDAAAATSSSPADLARRAHAVEVQSLGQQSGIQDQIAASYGGVNFIEIARYPDAVVESLSLTPSTRRALDARLLLVYLGRAHDSSAVHDEVIAGLAAEGSRRTILDSLRVLAREGRDALLSGDLTAYGRTLAANCDLQTALHPALVCASAAQVIAVARTQDAAGWKVNGAGGDGGSVTVLCSSAPGARDLLARQVERTVPGARVLPVTLSATGVTVHPA